ncbi:tRNA-binding protein [Psychromonas arctica]|uniref:tRNA-binding protein n=1 Tax=Psychromonas arctica TaxID=168275 RepID=UPI000414C591|nr:tRNA-binding protein [Psychromonas arctica]
MNDLGWDEFQRVEIRVGTIIKVEDFPKARNPAFILHIDFGEALGVKKSSAQITVLYTKETLLGKKVMAVTNFPAKQIGPVMSECLVTGFHRPDGAVVLAAPDLDIADGTRLA